MKEICVVHLVRSPGGLAPLRRFLESYRSCPAEIDHDLLIIFKGFDASQSKAEYAQLLAQLNHITMDVSDDGVDITAYMAAVRQYAQHYRYFCFLNSFSLIQDTGWLKKLYSHISQPGVGLVGASGSWVSHRTNALAHLRNPVSYMRSMRKKSTPDPKMVPASLGRRIASVMEYLLHIPVYLTCFDPWPNYFIRTNAFMISGELMEMLNPSPVKTKLDAYKFESGKEGLTKRILATGKKVLVVGKDGKGYEKETWDKSNTLFQLEQENLLVADNRTNEYQYGTPARRQYLSAKAWHNS